MKTYDFYLKLSFLFLGYYFYLIYFKLNLIDFIELRVLSILLLMAILDARYYLIPKNLNLLLFFLALKRGLKFLTKVNLIYIIVIVLISIFMKEYIGLGDLKVFFNLSIFLDNYSFLLLVRTSIILASIYSLIKYIYYWTLNIKIETLKIPFCPFIFISYFIVIY